MLNSYDDHRCFMLSFHGDQLVLSEHLKPETVTFHCHSPTLIVLFVLHGSFTNTDIILIGIAKLSQTQWLFISGSCQKKVSLISY